MFPMVKLCRLTTRSSGALVPDHMHRAYPDAGNGMTDMVASHFHYIRDGRILPSSADGHTHNLLNVICGAERL
jgi:hypothetical protein